MPSKTVFYFFPYANMSEWCQRSANVCSQGMEQVVFHNNFHEMRFVIGSALTAISLLNSNMYPISMNRFNYKRGQKADPGLHTSAITTCAGSTPCKQNKLTYYLIYIAKKLTWFLQQNRGTPFGIKICFFFKSQLK